MVQARPLMEARIEPVTAVDALDWIRGEIHDDELLARPSKPECVFIYNLPDRSAWRDAVRKILQLRSAGAKLLIARTGIPSIERHLLDAVATCTLKETSAEGIKNRFVLMPAEFEVYFGRLARALSLTMRGMLIGSATGGFIK